MSWKGLVELCHCDNQSAVCALQEGGGGYYKDGAMAHMRKLQQELERTGVDWGGYLGHSFCIGAAATTASVGEEDSLIKMLDRWESVAYLLHARVSW